MTDEASSALNIAWQEFDAPLRFRKGFDENAYVALNSALQTSLNPGLLAMQFLASEPKFSLVSSQPQKRMPVFMPARRRTGMEAAYELQELVGECVGLDSELPA